MTDPKSAAEALRFSEQRYALALEASGEGHWDWDVLTDELFFSEHAQRLYGLDPGRATRARHEWRAAIRYHPDDAAHRLAIDDFLGSGETKFHAEWRVIHADGSARWTRNRAVCLRDESGLAYRVVGTVADIDAERRALDELRRSQERFALAVAATADGIWDWDVAEGPMFVSEHTQRLFGLEVGPTTRSRAEWMSFVHYHPDDAGRRQRVLDDIANGSIDRYDDEGRVLHPDGTYRWIRYRGVCSRDATGQVTRLTGSVSDIDAQKRNEVALRQSEERFALAVAAAADGIWDWDILQDRVFLSERTQRIFGLEVGPTTRSQAEWATMFQYHPEDSARRRRMLRGFINGTIDRHEDEWRVLHPDGTHRWIRYRGLCMRDAAGRATRLTGSVSDIDAQKRNEVALRRSEERFALAAAAAEDGIWDWDVLDGRMFLSDRAQRILGFEPGPSTRPRDEWTGMLKVHPDDEERRRVVVARSLSGAADRYEIEWRILDPGGRYRWLRYRGFCVRDTQGNVIRMIGTITDIDTQKHAEAGRRQAQRLEAMGTLAGGIAHDFNNILGAILGYGEMALRDAPKGSRLRRDIASVMSAGERGRALVDRILAFSRAGVGERVAVPVEDIVREALDLVASKLTAGIRIETRLQAGLAAMLGDPSQVHQVVMNLITNAIQAMPAGGALEVTLETARHDGPQATAIGTLTGGDYIVLTVSDSGGGIAPDIIDRIFDPFFTTKDVGVGTGLGLALVHGIVIDFGGAIDIASTVGAGSTFTVYLPRVGDVSGDAHAIADAAPRGDQQRVLIVDDEEPLVRLATETLERLGYAPVGFTSSAAALEAFRADPEQFDAVMTDERMPGMSGLALVREIRGIRRRIPILLVSGNLSAAVVSQAREAGIEQLLKKPFLAHELATSVARTLQAR